MSILDNIPTPELWEYISTNCGDKAPQLAFLRALVAKYRGQEPAVISLYEFKAILKESGLKNKVTEKQVVDFLCFDLELLDLYFRFIDDLDEHFDFDLESIQEVLSQEKLNIGNKVYSASAVQKNLFTQFSPTKNFLRLLESAS
jgi:hypothetical protein